MADGSDPLFSGHKPPQEGDRVSEIRIASILALKAPLLDEILAVLSRLGCLPPQDVLRTRLCLEEAVTNAIGHGNRHDPRKLVTVHIDVAPEHWNVTVHDEGEGFGSEDLPDPDHPDALLSESGRGVLLMREFMDDVRYFDAGRCVRLRRLRPPAPPGDPAEPRILVSHLSEQDTVLRLHADALEDQIARQIDGEMDRVLKLVGTRTATLDLSDVTYLTSAGISLLVRLRHRLLEQGARLKGLTGLTSHLKAVLRAAHADQLFPFL